jgi:hypothetical protein
MASSTASSVSEKQSDKLEDKNKPSDWIMSSIRGLFFIKNYRKRHAHRYKQIPRQVDLDYRASLQLVFRQRKVACIRFQLRQNLS